jgi:hypothetical protein
MEVSGFRGETSYKKTPVMQIYPDSSFTQDLSDSCDTMADKWTITVHDCIFLRKTSLVWDNAFAVLRRPFAVLIFILSSFVWVLTLSPASVADSTADSKFVYGASNDGGDDVDGQFGPYDYYRPPKTVHAPIALVESAHLGFIVADQLRQKDYCGYQSNLNYTLRAFPNHPKALVMMAEYLAAHRPCPAREEPNSVANSVWAIENNSWQERNTDFFFQTALNFMTEDTRVIPKYAETHALYGDWLRKNGRADEAMTQYEAARALKPGYANTYYGLGMLYLDQKNIAKATENAKKAYALGKPPTDLKDRLVAAGSWPSAGAAKKSTP